MDAHSKKGHKDTNMRINPIQNETFGSTNTAAVQAAKKGYSVLIDGQQYFVGTIAEKSSTLDHLINTVKKSLPKTTTSKLNLLA